MGKKLIRKMKAVVEEGFTRPVLGQNISKVLGVRHCFTSVYNEDDNIDIQTDDNGIIKNLLQGMSVSPAPKSNLPKHHQKLRNGENHFSINQDFFDSNADLEYIEDEVLMGEVAKHGIIAPRYEMHIDYYISCLSATRGFWEVLNESIESEIGNPSALTRQLDAESKGVHYRSDR